MTDKSSGELSVWETLSRVDVSGFTEKKNGMTYLSWAHSWGVLKSFYPDATFEKIMFENKIFRTPDGPCVTMRLPYLVDINGYGFVQVLVMAGGSHAAEVFPILDYKNKPIQWPTSFDVNTALQRCLAKSIAFLGLGHYVYAGEDLPINFESHGEEAAITDMNGDTQIISTIEKIKAVFMEMIPLHKDVDELTKFYTANEKALEFLQTKNADVYAEVVGAFSKAKKTLTAKKKEEDNV